MDMAETLSPSHTNGPIEGSGYLYGSSPPEDISLRMKVPKRIKANGEIADDDVLMTNNLHQWDIPEKFDMNVPDRIMLLGQNQHIGTRAPPREIVLENSVLGGTISMNEVRVNTPPRVITLEEHHFPCAAELPVHTSPPISPHSSVSHKSLKTTTVPDVNTSYNDSRIIFREVTPPIEGLTPADEVIHLRRQVARINRRVMALEMDSLQRQQKERIFYVFGIAYILYKVIAWLNRS